MLNERETITGLKRRFIYLRSPDVRSFGPKTKLCPGIIGKDVLDKVKGETKVAFVFELGWRRRMEPNIRQYVERRRQRVVNIRDPGKEEDHCLRPEVLIPKQNSTAKADYRIYHQKKKS